MTLTILHGNYVVLHQQELLGVEPTRYTLLCYRELDGEGYWETPSPEPPQGMLAKAVQLQMLTAELREFLLRVSSWYRYEPPFPTGEWLIGARFALNPLCRQAVAPMALLEGGYAVIGRRRQDGLYQITVPYLARLTRGRGKRVYPLVAMPQPWEPAPENPHPLHLNWLYRALHYGKLNAPLRRWLRTTPVVWMPFEVVERE
jgi:hypothetical protein